MSWYRDIMERPTVWPASISCSCNRKHSVTLSSGKPGRLTGKTVLEKKNLKRKKENNFFMG